MDTAGERAGLLWALLAIALWSSLAAVVGDALTGVRPGTLLLYSLLFALPALVTTDAVGGRLAAALVPRPSLVALGLWGIFGYHALLFVALEQAPLVEANLLNYLWPLFMVLLAPALARERLAKGPLVGAVVGFAGAALVVTQGRMMVLSSAHAAGYFYAALAALAWASFSVGLRRLGPLAGGRMTLFTLVSLPPALAFALLRGEAAPPPLKGLLACAWLGIGPMGLAFHFWDRALQRSSAQRVGALSYLDPLLSTLVVAVALGRELTAPSIAGMVLITGGAALPALAALRRPGLSAAG